MEERCVCVLGLFAWLLSKEKHVGLDSLFLEEIRINVIILHSLLLTLFFIIAIDFRRRKTTFRRKVGFE